MKKVAIVGVEGSGKTVMLAGLGDLYTYPDEKGYFLAPKNFGTAAYVAEKIERMRKGEWPVATAGDEMQGLDWTLKRRKTGVKGRPESVCEVSFLDFAGEVYRAAYGISGADDASLKEQAEELKQYVCGADELIVLINLRDVITNGLRDKRVQEAMWITKSILDTAIGDNAGKDAPRAAIVLSQADSYAETIKSCGGAQGVLEKYLPHVANDYGWLDVFAANAVDKTELDGDGNVVPAADFTTQGLLPILAWIHGEEVSDGGRGATALPDDGRAQSPAALQRDNGTGAPGVCALPGGVELSRASEAANAHGKVHLWEDGPYWAETNIGAEEPWESGYYFWWGDTVGYRRAKVNVSGWLNRLFSPGEVWAASDGSASKCSFKIDNTPTSDKDFTTLEREGWTNRGSVLVPNHDAAHVKWGGGWRMPTEQELSDLCERCDWTWTTMHGVKGCVVRGRGDYSSASIFLPAAGHGEGTSLYGDGSDGWYSSSIGAVTTNLPLLAWPYKHGVVVGLCVDSSGGKNFIFPRHYGISVRPVQGFTK
ncbi:MAG: hypothetical protein IJL17_22720 [Kiritimatiellae bacterium]|nr:hypothetical protein [Kiritimatiellia bacterium]